MTDRNADSPPSDSGVGYRRVALIVAVAWFMQNLDTTIIVTSLPQMADTFGVAPVDVNLGITAHLVAAASFIPLGGWLADKYGARRVFAVAIVVFGVASIGCAASSTLWQFALARVVQGLGGALMVPVGRIVVLRSTEPSQLLRATALITWPGLIAPVIAPVLGGALTTWYGWQWIFLINVPIAVVGAVLVLMFIPDSGARDAGPLDRLGTILIIGALGLSIYGLSALAQGSNLALNLALLVVGTGLGVAAVWWLRRAENPLIDLGPVRVPTYAAVILSGGNLIRVAILATPFLLPLMMQKAWGLSPLDAGKLVLVYAVGNLVMKAVTTPLLQSLGFRSVLVVNGVAVGFSLATCGLLVSGTPVAIVCVVAFLAGAARSLQFTALNTLAFADIEPRHRAPAATLFSMQQQVATAVGVAGAALVLVVAQGGDDSLSQADFTVAFVVAAALALVGALMLLRLRPDAGQAVSGHRPRASRSPVDSGVEPGSGGG